MAKRRRRIKALQDEEKLIEMSADNARGLANNFKGVSEALTIVIKNLEKVADAADESEKKTKSFKDQMLEASNIGDALKKTLASNLDKLDQSGTLSNILKGNLKETATFANFAAAGSAMFVGTLINGILKLDALQTQLATTFGLSDQQATNVTEKLFSISKNSGNTLINFQDVAKVVKGIGDETGILASTLRSDVLEEAAELQKTLGLSNKGMANLAFNAQVTGQNMEEQTKSMARGLAAATIVAAEKSNLYFGTGLLSDHNEVKVIDMADIDGSQNVRIVMRFTAGIQHGIGSDIVLYS